MCVRKTQSSRIQWKTNANQANPFVFHANLFVFHWILENCVWLPLIHVMFACRTNAVVQDKWKTNAVICPTFLCPERWFQHALCHSPLSGTMVRMVSACIVSIRMSGRDLSGIIGIHWNYSDSTSRFPFSIPSSYPKRYPVPWKGTTWSGSGRKGRTEPGTQAAGSHAGGRRRYIRRWGGSVRSEPSCSYAKA